ncbi:MAG TPA: hypothetical protein VFG48_12455, partial [Xanthomonadales bacterium]|nr:hypothetical protein [Xanthomonadales bacterium]
MHFALLGQPGVNHRQVEGRADPARDVFLHGKQVLALPVILARPQVIPVGSVDQFRGDAQLIIELPDTACQDGLHVELSSDIADVYVAVAETERGSPGGNPQAGDPAQRIDDFFGDAFAEVTLVAMFAHVIERQDRDGWDSVAPPGAHGATRSCPYRGVLDDTFGSY